MLTHNIGKDRIGVLLMTEGGPNSPDEVEAFLKRARHGTPPTQDEVEDLKGKYSRIGGRSPLLERTKEQAKALEETLNRQAIQAKVYVGMKYWHPLIYETVPMMVYDRIRRNVAIALAPFYSRISIGGYEERLLEAQKKVDIPIDVSFVKSWNSHPLFLQAWLEKIREALGLLPRMMKDDIFTVFTAHTLPEKILEWDDPYPKQLHVTCQQIADALKLRNWNLSYQSGVFLEKRLGPDILTTLKELSQKGYQNVLLVPIGFVATHFEILCYLDVECQDFAKRNGINFWRTDALDAAPTFIAALAGIAREQMTRFNHR